MENYLYFRKNRPVSASVTLGSATQTCPAFSAADIGVLANNDNENEIVAISIKSLDGGGTGHATVLFTPSAIVPTLAYSSDALAIATGTTHWVNPGGTGTSYENGILVLGAHTDAGGYTLDTGDIVTAYFATGLETACMYPATSYLGAVATDADTSVLHFKAILGTAADDTITVEHAAGGFESLVKMMNDAVNGYPREGKLISVIDGHDGYVRTLDKNNAAGITTIEYAPQGGAAGMAT